MHVIDLIAKVVLITLAGAFMAGVLVGLAVIGYALYRDFFLRDEYDYDSFRSSLTIGPHGRNALAILKPWFRRLFLVWVSAVATAVIWVVIHMVFASSN